jgi:hypothetical protein
MKRNGKYQTLKEIPIKGGKAIPAGTLITVTNGCLYMEGGLLPQDYQADFKDLIDNEEVSGWKYIVPFHEETAFKNSKEDVE